MNLEFLYANICSEPALYQTQRNLKPLSKGALERDPRTYSGPPIRTGEALELMWMAGTVLAAFVAQLGAGQAAHSHSDSTQLIS